jgi:hypothetical protein
LRVRVEGFTRGYTVNTHKQEVSIVQNLKLETHLHWPRVVPQQDILQLDFPSQSRSISRGVTDSSRDRKEQVQVRGGGHPRGLITVDKYIIFLPTINTNTVDVFDQKDHMLIFSSSIGFFFPALASSFQHQLHY